MGKLDGKVAVITGGTSGIGEATVRLFVEEGARVTIAARSRDKGRKLVEELGDSVAYHRTDVSNEADVKGAIDHTLEKFGRLDCMFNNAGSGGVQGGIESIAVEGFDETIGVLLRGVFLGMKHAAPIMKRQGSGSIISTSSVCGLRAGYGPHIYSAAKAAVNNLTRSVALELGESGVRVNCICPGGIITPIWVGSAVVSEETAERMLEQVEIRFRDAQPIKRAGLPEDIAQAALWLASDDSSFVNGEMLVVDGGLNAGRRWSDYLEGRKRLRSAMGLNMK